MKYEFGDRHVRRFRSALEARHISAKGNAMRGSRKCGTNKIRESAMLLFGQGISPSRSPLFIKNTYMTKEDECSRDIVRDKNYRHLQSRSLAPQNLSCCILD